jgi:PAS domain S-box-containing protein
LTSKVGRHPSGERAQTRPVQTSLDERHPGFSARIDLADCLRQMMDQAEILLAVIDSTGHVVAWNRALARLTGCEREEAEGQRLDEVLGDLGVRDLGEAMSAVSTTGIAVQRELRLPRRGTEPVHASFSVIPVRASE